MPYRLDRPIPEKNIGHRSEKLSGNKTARNKKVLSWLGVYIDRNKTRSYSFVYGHSPEICHKQSNWNNQDRNSRSLSRKVAFLEKVSWDQKGIWGKKYFVSPVGINEEVIRKYVQSQSEEETGQVQLEFWMYHACKGVGIDLAWISRYRRKIFAKAVKEYSEKILSHIPELYPDI